MIELVKSGFWKFQTITYGCRSRSGLLLRIVISCQNIYCILKAKSNFTLLLYIPLLGISEWYFKYVTFILKFNQLFI